MKNFEKYKTAMDREKAFISFCKGHAACEKCPIEKQCIVITDCAFRWLDLEAETNRSES